VQQWLKFRIHQPDDVNMKFFKSITIPLFSHIV